MHDGSRWARWLVPLLVVLLVLKTTYGAVGTFDVGFDDETIYLEAAHWAGKRFLPLADSSPLYPLFYRALSLFEPDPLRLYFLNWFVLTATLPVLLYALARRSGASLAAAAIVAVAWSFSGSMLTWPHISKFAAVLLGAGALVATFLRDRRLAGTAISLALTAAAFARAEFELPSLLLAGAVSIWSAWGFVRTARWPRSDRRTRERLRCLFAACVSAGAPIVLRRIFDDPHGGGRAFFAFGQHYALNVVAAEKLAVDPWTTWDRWVRAAFPHATTIGEALRENPRAFAWHLQRNIRNVGSSLEWLLGPLPHVPMPIAALAVLALTLVAIAGGWALCLNPSRRDRRLDGWLPLIGAVAVSTAASALIVYPREHYLLCFAWLALAMLAGACGHIRVPSFAARWGRLPSRLRSRNVAPSLLVGALLVLLAVLPTRGDTLPAMLAASGPPMPTAHEGRRTIEAIRALHLQGRVVILESDRSRGVYASLDYVRIRQWDKHESFWAFVHAQGIELIVLNDRLRSDPRFASDPEFVRFSEGAERAEDFEFIPVSDTGVVLAVRRSLLSRSAR